MSTKPPATLHYAPAAAGKTKFVVQLLAAPRQRRAVVLVPSGLHRDRLRAQVAGIPRTNVYQFARLASLVLRRARQTTLQLDMVTRGLLIGAVLRELRDAGRLPRYANVAHKPGFVAAVAALLDETQDAEVDPAALAAAAVTPYDAELGTICVVYLERQSALGHADPARRLVLARNALQATPGLLRDVELFVVDGFDQFTPLQASLLREVAVQAQRTVITLTGTDEQRLAHRRFITTSAQLQRLLDLDVQPLPQPQPHPLAPALAHMERHLFDLDPVPPIDANTSIAAIAAPDREREVRATLRTVHALLAAGSPPESIAVLYRRGETYLPLLREVGGEYSLRLAIHEGQRLGDAPPVVALLALLGLPLKGFPRRALLDVWRSLGPQSPARIGIDSTLPSFGAAAALLDRATRHNGLARNAERIATTLETLASAETMLPDDEHEPIVLPAQALVLQHLLATFVAWLTPPVNARRGEYIAWLRTRIDLSTDGTNADVPALFAFTAPQRSTLHKTLATLANAATTLNEASLSYVAFVGDLAAALEATRYDHANPMPGCVAVLPALAARGACFEHVVLLGMVDGEFPQRLPEPPFYTRRERRLLAQRGVVLPTQDPADERTLFYETVTRTRQSLTLTRTRLDERSNPLPPSPFYTALLDLFEPNSVAHTTIRAGSAPTLAEAVSPQEVLVALMEQGRGDETGRPGDRETGRQGALDSQLAALHTHVIRACAMEAEREGTGDYGPFEGLVDDAVVREALAQRFGASHRWSVTQINDYTTCPFRFAAAHVLHLEQTGEPEEGLKQVGRGRLYHAILARAGTTWAAMEHPHAAAHEDAVLAALDSAAAAVLGEAPERYGFDPGTFWEWDQADIRRRLVQAIRRTLQDEGWAAFRPAGVEQSFGLRQGAPPLRVSTHAGDVLVAGRIDRIDQADDKSLALIDYKSSGTPRSLTETLEGRDVQLPIYLLAVEQQIAPGQQVAQAAFVHLGSGKRSAPLTAEKREIAVAAAHERIAEAVVGAQAGVFTVRPRDECPTHCAFVGICRRNLRKRDAQADAPQ